MESSLLQSSLFALNRPEPIRQASLLMVLASGVGHGDALIQGLRSHADECGSPWADRVTTLRVLLEQGLLLSSALRGNPGLLPETVISSIHIAEQTGTLREVLADEAQRLAQGSRGGPIVGLSLSNALLWLLIVGTIMMSLVMFLMTHIVPKFKKIFEDFGTDLPWLTTVLFDLSDVSTNLGPLFVMPCLAMVFALAAGKVYVSYLKITRGSPPGAEHWPRFWVPDVLRMLGLTVATGHPLQETLHSFVSNMRPGRAATAFSGARYRMQTGLDCMTAMREEKLICPREEAFLQASARTGHLDWGFRHLAQSLDSRRLRWLSRLGQLLEPGVILLGGMFVMFVILAMFLPLIKLLNDLS